MTPLKGQFEYLSRIIEQSYEQMEKAERDNNMQRILAERRQKAIIDVQKRELMLEEREK